MSPKELQKRNERSQNLRVVQVDDSNFYVESSEGKICYRVSFENDRQVCTCGDYTRGIKTDPSFRCKHIISVYNCIPSGDVQHGQVLERIKPRLDERWITTIEGKDFVRYPGLLDLSHSKGLSQIEVEVLQLPTKENDQFAVCKATVVSRVGETFVDIGDANPTNCSAKVSKHLLRMASTRAIARALRSFCNVGETALEELDPADVAGNGSSSKPKPIKQASKPPKGTKEPHPVVAISASTDPNHGNGDNGTKSTSRPTEPKAPDPIPEQPKTQSPSVPTMSEAQKRAIYNLSRRRGISVEELTRMVVDAYGVELEHLTSKDASSFIRNLQQAA